MEGELKPWTSMRSDMSFARSCTAFEKRRPEPLRSLFSGITCTERSFLHIEPRLTLVLGTTTAIEPRKTLKVCHHIARRMH